MSETSSGYDLRSSPLLTSTSSSSAHNICSPLPTGGHGTDGSLGPSPSQSPDSARHLMSPTNNMNESTTTATAATALADAAQRKFSNTSSNAPGSPSHHNHLQPFFTFALKYEEDNGLICIDFIVSFLLPWWLWKQSGRHFILIGA